MGMYDAASDLDYYCGDADPYEFVAPTWREAREREEARWRESIDRGADSPRHAGPSRTRARGGASHEGRKDTGASGAPVSTLLGVRNVSTGKKEGDIFARMSSVMADIGAISKGQENKFDHYRFRGIDDVYNALQPALVKHGVIVVPTLAQMERRDFETSKGSAQQLVVVTVKYRFCAPDGTYVEAVAPGEGADRGDKAVNKAMSGAYKNAMFQTFCIPTDERKDSEYESPELGVRADGPAEARTAAPRQPPGSGDKSGRWSQYRIGFGLWKDRTWGWLAEGDYEGKRHNWIVDQLERKDLDPTTRKRLEFVFERIETKAPEQSNG